MSHFDEKAGIVPCRTDFGRWYQNVSDVTVEVDLPPGTRAKDVIVLIRDLKNSGAWPFVVFFSFTGCPGSI